MHAITHLLKTKKQLAFLVAVLSALTVSLMFFTSGSVFALDGNYSWKDHDTIQYSGGDLGSGTLAVNNISQVTYKGQCTLWLFTSVNSGDASATIRSNGGASASSSGSSTVLPACTSDQGYNNKLVAISGTRPAPDNNKAETTQQKSVGIYVNTYKGQSQPNSLTLTIKNSADKVVRVLSSAKTSNSGSNVYIATTSLDPGSYQICFSSLISGCQTFTKVKYKALTLNYGSTTDTTLINVDLSVNPTVNGTDTVTVGPFKISLTDSKENIQTATTESKQLEGKGTGGVITTEFKVSFKGVKPGTYKVCLVNSTVCQSVKKIDGEVANVTLTAGGTDTAAAQPTDASGPECGNSTSQLSWLICPMFDLTQKSADTLNGIITNLLDINTCQIFGASSTSKSSCTASNNDTAKSFKSAWSSMRNIAILVIVIAALVMIIAQAIGSQMIDAYTIKSVLPRLLIAAVFIALSWYVMEFLVQFSNVLGEGVRTLIYSPFSSLNSGAGHSIMSGAGGIGVLLGGGLALAVGVILLLSFAGTILLALMVGLLVIVLRQIVVIFLIIVAPIAIAAYALPGTKKSFKLWWDSLFKVLMMFPLIVAFIAIGRVFAAVLLATGGWVQMIIAIIAYVIPFFLLPFTLKLSGGAMGAIGGAIHTQSQKVNGMIGKRRGARWSRRLENAQGYNAFAGGTEHNFRGRLNRTLGTLTNARQARLNPRTMRANMQAHHSAHSLDAAAAGMEKNSDFRAIANDDTLLAAALSGQGTEADVRNYLMGQGQTGRVLEQNVAAVTRARRSMGDHAFRVAAVMAMPGTGTGFAGGSGEMLAAINDVAGDDRALAGRMLAAAKQAGGQARRPDLGGPGYGDLWRQLEAMHNGTSTAGQATADLDRAALRGQSGNYIVGARRPVVERLAPAMRDEVNEALVSGDEIAIMRQLATVAGRYDAMAQVAPENAEVMASQVMGQTLVAAAGNPNFTNDDGTTMTIRQMVERYRGNDQFLNMRREYANAAAAAAAAAGGENLGGGAPGPGGPPAPGGVPVP